jgi:hypothetical protein
MKNIRNNIVVSVGNNLIGHLGANISGNCRIKITIYLTEKISGPINTPIRRNISLRIYSAVQQFRF